ncbi:hypothetical protein ASC89_20015 [Devosia sp. Root413D1]|jgi:hypothetical protein|uniref:hypothetical protein n=1 Tax=unclassified Devosia TaxID=196773 RepID=UPI0006F6F348|nr:MULTISPECIES: hypothetical protein [unclassified Devosia]KQU97566.1 hypothetical protein ASC68_12300 [Devosia sp. Root105]KQW77463.1 hypothetical protein ASC89_20015 [Devosia sp. Root413D1]
MHNQIHLVSAGASDALIETQSAGIIQPCRRYIEGWQLRATYLAEQLALHPRGSDAYELAETRLAELRGEIAANRDYLVVEASRLPPDDLVDATLDELDALLASLSRAASASS